MPPTRPRTRARIEPRFRIHADKLFFKRERLWIRGLNVFHGEESGRKISARNNLMPGIIYGIVYQTRSLRGSPQWQGPFILTIANEWLRGSFHALTNPL